MFLYIVKNQSAFSGILFKIQTVKGAALKLLLFVINLFICSKLLAGEVYEQLPENIDKNASYVFYSHGYIVEGDNPTPVHQRWGVYDFSAIKDALSDPRYHLIATHRAFKTDPFAYAENLAKQVRQLIEAGVAAHKISLIGFSRGGFITALTSSYLANTEVNFVILAACTSGLAKKNDVLIHGHLLSIYETSDSVGSCDHLVARKPELVTSYKELAISTGKEHGAFYTPLESWLLPVKQWLKQQRG